MKSFSSERFTHHAPSICPVRTGYFVFLVLLSGCGDKRGTAPVDNAAALEKLDLRRARR
jgi:hypothetical protein